jgi:hypothetical protein
MFELAKTLTILKVVPEQPYLTCYGLRVGSGEAVSDGSKLLPTQTFDVNRIGTWKQSADIGQYGRDDNPNKTARAWSIVTITSFTRNTDGALTVVGFVQSSGRTPGVNGHKAFAFSASSIKISGGADVPRVVVDWGPSLTTQTGGQSSRAFDPVSLHLVDPKGKVRRTEELLNVVMSTKGPGAMHWRGDGQLSVDSDEAELQVRMPSTLVKERGELKLAVKAGAVSQRTATGSLAAHRLPAVGERTRIAQTTGSGTPARLTGLAEKSSKAMKFDIAVPKLAAGERFELRLGGGGGQEQ